MNMFVNVCVSCVIINVVEAVLFWFFSWCVNRWISFTRKAISKAHIEYIVRIWFIVIAHVSTVHHINRPSYQFHSINGHNNDDSILGGRNTKLHLLYISFVVVILLRPPSTEWMYENRQNNKNNKSYSYYSWRYNNIVCLVWRFYYFGFSFGRNACIFKVNTVSVSQWSISLQVPLFAN